MPIRATFIALAAASLFAVGCQQGAADAGPSPTPPPVAHGSNRAAATGGLCGGIAGFTCADAADYCKHPDGLCRMPDGAGVCTPKTPMCTRIYRPVCGCDGKTYGNACEAGAAGVSVEREGACKSE